MCVLENREKSGESRKQLLRRPVFPLTVFIIVYICYRAPHFNIYIRFFRPNIFSPRENLLRASTKSDLSRKYLQLLHESVENNLPKEIFLHELLHGVDVARNFFLHVRISCGSDRGYFSRAYKPSKIGTWKCPYYAIIL